MTLSKLECTPGTIPANGRTAAKMKYTRSCAVSGMVGHVLGIGDQHMHNILIQETTGEVVHIDFGIVFEQGKVSSCAHVRAF